ncbi:MAG: PQQ-binding-like beta-propeller repeat protein [Alphaproteobacteria bacterium]|jgi:outer membrane protein assembly factor BamB|nr:PQQ-binding-like beta-propeller repeat protein [Alphaproteobacteria bacterium]MBT4710200.1 PQQ-binding-like beta-propeller repeat protein [Alphaproteobacteria bacterium]MBT5860000.1 PQQ-binding-like beta-propeller repeat protein [Alphaproteobacteria bacterium]
MVRGLAIAAAALILGGCAQVTDFFESAQEEILPGERFSVLTLEKSIEADPGLAEIVLQLPRPYINAEWPQAGGHSSHAMHHLALADNIGRIWTTDVGQGSTPNSRITASPVVAAGIVFTLDADTTVTATRAADGWILWSRNLAPAFEEVGAMGGGLATEAGILYVSTPYGDLAALDGANGALIWAQQIGVPIRSAPTVAGSRVFAVTVDNRLHAMSSTTGEILWTHEGFNEIAGLVGGASPAVDGDTVVVPYSSGEIFALRAENGRASWSDSLSRVGRVEALAQISDIRGQPVIDRGTVFVVSHGGRMAAIDMRSGVRLWEQDIASVETPWVAGDSLFLVTVDAEVVALSRLDGRVRWVRQLTQFSDRNNEEPIQWTGPTLAGDRLIVAASTGDVIAISPYTGRILGSLRLSDGVSIPAIVADGTLYILTDGAELVAYR